MIWEHRPIRYVDSKDNTVDSEDNTVGSRVIMRRMKYEYPGNGIYHGWNMDMHEPNIPTTQGGLFPLSALIVCTWR
jgi:hypothetical protein